MKLPWFSRRPTLRASLPHPAELWAPITNNAEGEVEVKLTIPERSYRSVENLAALTAQVPGTIILHGFELYKLFVAGRLRITDENGQNPSPITFEPQNQAAATKPGGST